VLTDALHLQCVLQAIVNGLRQSVKDFQSTVAGVTPQDVLELILVTQYYQMLREVRWVVLAALQCIVGISNAVGGLGHWANMLRALLIIACSHASVWCPAQHSCVRPSHPSYEGVTCTLPCPVPAGWCTAEDQHSLHAFRGRQRSWWPAGSQECYDGSLCCTTNEQSIGYLMRVPELRTIVGTDSVRVQCLL
jgi:hypothetical protein